MAGFHCCLQGSSRDYIMATGVPDTRQTSENKELNEKSSGKKKSKFKAFKNFFAKKKGKVTAASRGENALKPSQSSTDVSTAEPSEVYPDAEVGSQGNIGNRSFSHDSIFIPELSISEAVPVRGLSQENVAGKVKALQLQLEQNIRLASPGVLISSKKAEDAGTMSEDDGLPRSPPEILSLHTVLRCSTPKSAVPVERHNSLSFGGTESEDEELISSMPSSRPLSPLVHLTTSSDSLPVDFSLPASSLTCLDNSAAKHKIAVNPRKHKFFAKQTKPTIREDSGSPKDKRLPNGRKQEIDSSGEEDINIHRNKMPWSKCLEVNDEECAVKVPKVSRPTSDGHVPEPEDGDNTNLDGDMSLPPSICEILSSEPGFTSEDLPDPEKTPRIARVTPETFCPHEDDSKLSSIKAIADLNKSDAVPFFLAPTATLPECSGNNVLDAAKSATSKGPLLENVERDSVSSATDASPSLESISPALPQEARERETILNILSAPEHSLTAKPAAGATLSDETLGSSEDWKGCMENIFTNQSTVEENDGEILLNQRPAHIPKPCHDQTDNIGLISEFPHETNQLVLSTPQLDCSWAPPELSISNELSQENQKASSQGSIKFSIASAWQRSVMDAKKWNMEFCLPTVPTSGYCENTAEERANEALSSQEIEEVIRPQQVLNAPLKVKLDETEPASPDNGLKVMVPSPKAGLNAKGSPFGIRLRRTSPLHSYLTEVGLEQKEAVRRASIGVTTSQAPTFWKGDGGISGQVEASLATRSERDISKNAAKLFPEGQTGGCLMSEKTNSLDPSTEPVKQEKYRAPGVKNERKNSETYPNFGKTSESPRANSSKPVWVSLARQKQKGFQDQYSGTQLSEDRPLMVQTGINKEPTTQSMKNIGEKEPHISFQSKETKIIVKDEHPSRITTSPRLGSHLQPKPPAYGMGLRERGPLPGTKLAPLAAVEPPWLAIAKKKAKAWSDMPQTVQ
ncbi:CRACD-like protein isoform X2 [Narcine bancroftii]|uniref:CRACD-like protein isoform X2 n=1 Tax=Narcine bancroftii TaxID=1343680 RepID=UPI003830FE50